VWTQVHESSILSMPTLVHRSFSEGGFYPKNKKLWRLAKVFLF